MKRAWSVRAYKKGDETGILELMRAVYPEKKFSKEKWMIWWRWMFTECPAGKARIWLAEHDGKIVGQYPLTLADLKIGNEFTKVSQNIELMTHPDYRHQGMFLALEKKALEEAEKEGIYFTIGFPNVAAYLGHIKTGWFNIGSLQIGVKPINFERLLKTGIKNNFLKTVYRIGGKIIINLFYREKKIPKSENLKISQITSFDSRINVFWKKISNVYEIITVRNKEYLNWRYVDVPEVDYIIYIAEEKGEIRGYIVFRRYDVKDIKSGCIFDFVTPLNRPDIAYNLLSKTIEFFKSQNVDFMYYMMFSNKKIRKIFKKKGFIFSPRIYSRFVEGGQFIVYSRHPNVSKEFLMNKENWYIQLGDSDTL